MIDTAMQLTVLVRSSSARRLAMLDQALFSLATQHWPHIEVLVMLQNPDDAFRQAVETLIDSFVWPGPARVRAIPVAVDAGLDGRSRLINAGVAAATGRYLAFLDDDDVVYPHGYTRLIGRLRANPAAVMAAGGCRMAWLEEVDGDLRLLKKELGSFGWGKSKFDLFQDNFIPIHSYIVDLARFPKEKVVFRDEVVPLEDYDFLVRLAQGGGFDLSLTSEPVCEYRLHGGNTIWDNGEQPKTVPPALKRARRGLADVVEEAVMTITREEWVALAAQRIPPAPAPVPAVVAPPVSLAGPLMDAVVTPAMPPEMDLFQTAPQRDSLLLGPTPPPKRFLHRRADDAYRALEATGPLYRGVVRAYLAMKGPAKD